MGLTDTDYLRQAQGLLPPGPAWPREDDAFLTRLLSGLSIELARVDDRARRLIDEGDPRTTAELLEDYERIAGLPDGCVTSGGVELSTAQRRQALFGRLTMQGAQSAAYFIALAASLGYTVTITEFHVYDVNDDVDASIWGQPWSSAWQINAQLNTVFEFTVIDGADDPLASWNNVVLECVLNRFKPAHTTVIFSYS